MTGTVFCDSAGVRVIGSAHKLAAAGSSEMRLVLGRSPVARILQITGLDQLMPVYPDVLESLATPRSGPDGKPASPPLPSPGAPYPHAPGPANAGSPAGTSKLCSVSTTSSASGRARTAGLISPSTWLLGSVRLIVRLRAERK